MQAIARAKFIRFAPRKVDQVLGLVRLKSVPQALDILRYVPRGCSTVVGKAIKSAAANAGDPQCKDGALKISSAWVGQGPVLKRMRAYAMGRGSTYKRKTAHLTIVVSDFKNKK